MQFNFQVLLITILILLAGCKKDCNKKSEIYHGQFRTTGWNNCGPAPPYNFDYLSDSTFYSVECGKSDSIIFFVGIWREIYFQKIEIWRAVCL